MNRLAGQGIAEIECRALSSILTWRSWRTHWSKCRWQHGSISFIAHEIRSLAHRLLSHVSP